MGHDPQPHALRPGLRLKGLLPGQSVYVEHVQPLESALKITYRNAQGRLGETLLYPEDLAQLEVEEDIEEQEEFPSEELEGAPWPPPAPSSSPAWWTTSGSTYRPKRRRRSGSACLRFWNAW
ncbi:hypothetical protein TJA_18930 [Thermus sp. LT1-2-5]|uniref:hypothetical protein n=1 Tax=Thermus sp. LT1-2-5 TaxID=3026935 RepID=UPI0030E854E9